LKRIDDGKKEGDSEEKQGKAVKVQQEQEALDKQNQIISIRNSSHNLLIMIMTSRTQAT
jgi:hypothetical protein